MSLTRSRKVCTCTHTPPFTCTHMHVPSRPLLALFGHPTPFTLTKSDSFEGTHTYTHTRTHIRRHTHVKAHTFEGTHTHTLSLSYTCTCPGAPPLPALAEPFSHTQCGSQSLTLPMGTQQLAGFATPGITNKAHTHTHATHTSNTHTRTHTHTTHTQHTHAHTHARTHTNTYTHAHACLDLCNFKCNQ